MSQPSMVATLRELFSYVPPRRRQLAPVLGLMMVGAGGILFRDRGKRWPSGRMFIFETFRTIRRSSASPASGAWPSLPQRPKKVYRYETQALTNASPIADCDSCETLEVQNAVNGIAAPGFS